MRKFIQYTGDHIVAVDPKIITRCVYDNKIVKLCYTDGIDARIEFFFGWSGNKKQFVSKIVNFDDLQFASPENKKRKNLTKVEVLNKIYFFDQED